MEDTGPVTGCENHEDKDGQLTIEDYTDHE
jgi:hypothetical protein